MAYPPVLYNAMVEVVKPPNMELATALFAEINLYILNSEMSDSEDYYTVEYLFQTKGGDDRTNLMELITPYALGAQVMKLENTEWMPYSYCSERTAFLSGCRNKKKSPRCAGSKKAKSTTLKFCTIEDLY